MNTPQPQPTTTTKTTNRRQFLGVASAGLGWAATGVSCKEAKAMLPWKHRPGSETEAFVSPQGENVDLISHALSRLTWGAAPGDYARVQALAGEGGTPEAALEAFINEQLAGDPSTDRHSAAARGVNSLTLLHEPVGELYDASPRELNTQLTQAALYRFVYSPFQLYEVMVSFWTDHFNIDCSKTECRWLKSLDDRTVIRKHALGNFRELLKASALSPAMLFYLDGRANRKEKPDDKPNENYARELLELHTMGVTGGYTQADIMEVARCLTGWTVNGKEHLQGDYRTARQSGNIAKVRNGFAALLGKKDAVSPFTGLGRVHFVKEWHDAGEKKLLGEPLRSEDPAAELDRVLDVLVKHPSTAKFIATKLCRRFIADAPPEAAVAAVAKSFLESKGDIKTTLRTLFATSEFRNVRGTKLKRPLHWVVSALRATGATTRVAGDVQQFLRRAGQLPFEFPTPDGYSDEAKDWTSGLLARWDAALRLATGQFQDSKLDAKQFLQAAGGRNGAMRHILARKPRAHELEAYGMVEEAGNQNPAGEGEFLALLLASPEFQQY